METTRSPRSESRRIRDKLLRSYCWIAGLLILYVLSTGPLYWEIYEAFHANGSPWLAAFYYPVVLACQFEPVSDWFNWYVGLWIGV